MQLGLPTGVTFRRLLPPILMIAGSALLLYVGLQYWTMYSEQHRLAREWESQQGRSTQTTKPADDGLTRLTIPKINLNAVVVEGTNRRSLLLGPGHLKETPAPGEIGNSVITGHRDTFFRHIYELTKGDTVTVQRNGRSYLYQVTGKKIVEPSDTSVTNSTTDSQLTLITCYPIYFVGPAPERLVVFTKLADANHPELEAAGPKAVKAAAGTH